MFDSMLDSEAGLLDALAESSVVENQAAYRKVAVAGQFWELWASRDVTVGDTDLVDCGNNAYAEIAVRLGCSKTMAENYATVGLDLRDRLPLVRNAFEAGELDYARASRISRNTLGYRDETIAIAEPAILAAGRMLSPGPLASEIDEILIRISPEEVAERRIEALRDRTIRKRKLGDLSRVEADLAPDEAESVWQRVCEVADTVCRHDRRGRRYRLADAYMALIRGEQFLECSCGQQDCPYATQPATPPRRKPLIQIGIDAATLLGLASNPAYLPGYGPIDPVLARELAADATWQAMLTDCADAYAARGARHRAGVIPAKALIYRPDADTAAIVRARDRHCRFPGCRMPADRCQLDHIESFDHSSPRSGGWTIASNLQCLCRFHHQLKTQRLWTAKALPGAVIRWIDSYGAEFVTEPGGHDAAIPPLPGLVPTVHAGPDQWEPDWLDNDDAPF